MKGRSRAIVILSILFGYVLLQFIWWEILLVRQTSTITEERQRLAALNYADTVAMEAEIAALQKKKNTQIIMIVSEGTVFLLLLLFGIYKIRQAQEREMALTRQQNNFFLSITHELKTPIAATKLQLQTLMKQQLEQEVKARLISAALQETERLNQLIDNVLLAGRLGAGSVEIRSEKINLSAETRELLQRYFKPHMENQRLRFISGGDQFAMVDRHWYPSILNNLVENAIKYTAVDTPVEVEIRKEKNRVILSVKDQGPGISAEDKKKIFERFYRVGSEEIRSSKGTGLGLYIVESLARKHGAMVEVKDNRPSGSNFEVVFYGA
jgi:two-component system, OmpR family, sensor histidine kinase CiaH